ncbi:MAG: type III pantothenate kinase [Salinivirgaceae bacterium]|nr:type III pantothenate kinase [Salinivirgaceae bacterium]
MCNLIIDEGNTLCKVAVAKQGTICELTAVADITPEFLQQLSEKHPISNIISISTRRDRVDIPKAFQAIPHLRPNASTKLPIKINYATPQTLGLDRIAAAVGASVLFPKSNVLIIDLGTAITIDFLDENNIYQGGVISPGPAMRAKALNTFTGKLPMVDLPEESKLTGKTTAEALQYGILNGVSYEIDGYIDAYNQLAENLKIVVTGGFANIIKRPDVNCEPNLVIIGLNKILEHSIAS